PVEGTKLGGTKDWTSLLPCGVDPRRTLIEGVGNAAGFETGIHLNNTSAGGPTLTVRNCVRGTIFWSCRFYSGLKIFDASGRWNTGKKQNSIASKKKTTETDFDSRYAPFKRARGVHFENTNFYVLVWNPDRLEGEPIETWSNDDENVDIPNFNCIVKFKSKNVRSAGVVIYQKTNDASNVVTSNMEVLLRCIREIDIGESSIGDICAVHCVLDDGVSW
ncbi:ATP-dependent DNA helicase, partial [Trichonephila clavipes]